MTDPGDPQNVSIDVAIGDCRRQVLKGYTRPMPDGRMTFVQVVPVSPAKALPLLAAAEVKA